MVLPRTELTARKRNQVRGARGPLKCVAARKLSARSKAAVVARNSALQRLARGGAPRCLDLEARGPGAGRLGLRGFHAEAMEGVGEVGFDASGVRAGDLPLWKMFRGRIGRGMVLDM